MPLSESEDFWPVVKFALICIVSIGICALAIANPDNVLRSRHQFQSWYHQYVYQMTNIAKQNCSEAYSIYLYGTKENTTQPTMDGAGAFTLYVQPMINCMLDNTSEYIKYQFASSQVILGLTPTIITLLGASSEELCLMALIGKRRLLGFLLATASPSIYTERAFKFRAPLDILEEEGSEKQIKWTTRDEYRWIFVCLEYIAVAACIVNIGTLNWQLGTKTINAVGPNSPYMLMFWSFLAIAAHLAGAVVFNMRARRSFPRNGVGPVRSQNDLTRVTSPTIASSFETFQGLRKERFGRVIWKAWKSLKTASKNEFCLKDKWITERLYVWNVTETRWYTLLAWMHSVLIVFHIIFGTLILSSTNFVGPKDAFGVMIRYITSVITCRVIIVYELAVLRLEYKEAMEGFDRAQQSAVPLTQVMQYPFK